MNSIQESYNPLNYGFKFVGDWYEFPKQEATEKAKLARDARAKELKAEGYKVTKWKLKGSLISRGGIGTGNPHIQLIVDTYWLEATK